MIHDRTSLTGRLRAAIDIAARIEELQSELNAVLAVLGSDIPAILSVTAPEVSTTRRVGRPRNIELLPAPVVEAPTKKPYKKRRFTKEGRKRMREAQERRWAKFHAVRNKAA